MEKRKKLLRALVVIGCVGGLVSLLATPYIVITAKTAMPVLTIMAALCSSSALMLISDRFANKNHLKINEKYLNKKNYQKQLNQPEFQKLLNLQFKKEDAQEVLNQLDSFYGKSEQRVKNISSIDEIQKTNQQLWVEIVALEKKIEEMKAE